MSALLAVLGKEWQQEWRSRASLNAAVLFALLAPIALSFGLAGARLEPQLLGGLLWSVLLFSALAGLPRAFVKEEESGTVWLLRLSCPADAVLAGKALFNASLLVLTQLAAVPVFVVMLGAKVEQWGLLLLVLALGDVGLAVSSTLLGAIAAQSRARGALLPALAAPCLLPLLVAASSATGASFGSKAQVTGALQLLAAYDVLVLALVWMLWEWVWE